MRSLIFGSVIATILLSVVACKKKSNDNPFGAARIATADVSHAGAILHYHFYYDSYRNIDSVIIVGDGTAVGHNNFMKYSYFGSSWTITDQSNYTFTVNANTAGVLLKVLVPDTLYYTYSGSQLTDMNHYTTIATPPYYLNTHTYYTWKDGDVVSSVTGTVTRTYTYNKSRDGQPGDALRIHDFLNYGRPVIRTTHLPSGYTQSSSIGASYNYGFDANGRISTMAEVNYDTDMGTSDTTFYTYSYY